MDKRSEEIINDILNGRTEPEEALKFLKTLRADEVSELFKNDKWSELLDGYCTKNKDLGIVPDLSKKKEDELWGRITAKENQGVSMCYEDVNIAGTLFDRIKMLIPMPSGYRYGGLTLALVLLLIIPLSLLHTTKKTPPAYYAMKGDTPGVGLSLEIARMVEGNLLVRPDKPFTEEDLLAFQIKTEREGFCSIFIIYGDVVDTVVREMPAVPGKNVVKTIYNPKGNKGKNNVVMQFTQRKLLLSDSEQMKMVMTAAEKQKPKYIINGEPVFFKYLSIVVN